MWADSASSATSARGIERYERGVFGGAKTGGPLWGTDELAVHGQLPAQEVDAVEGQAGRLTLA